MISLQREPGSTDRGSSQHPSGGSLWRGPWTRPKVLQALGGAMVLVLLAIFYGVVSEAVEAGQRKLAEDRRMADVGARCSSRSGADVQALCALTTPQRGSVRTTYATMSP